MRAKILIPSKNTRIDTSQVGIITSITDSVVGASINGQLLAFSGLAVQNGGTVLIGSALQPEERTKFEGILKKANYPYEVV